MKIRSFVHNFWLAVLLLFFVSPLSAETYAKTDTHVYSVMGSPAVFGSDWDASDQSTEMTLVDGLYTYMIENITLAAGTYYYVIMVDHSDITSYPPAPNSATLVIPENGTYTLTFIFNETTKDVTSRVVKAGSNVRSVYLNVKEWIMYEYNAKQYYVYASINKTNPVAVKMTKVYDYLYKAEIDKSATHVTYFCLPDDAASFSMASAVDKTDELTLSAVKDLYEIVIPTTSCNETSIGSWLVYDDAKYAKYYDYGTCGANLDYTVGRDKLLSIIGGGKMYGYFSYDLGCAGWAPWEAWSSLIDSISLPEGLTKIGTYAFEGYRVKNITIPSTVDTIGSGAILGANLTSIVCKATTPPGIDKKEIFNAGKGTGTYYHFCSNVNFSIPVYVPGTSINAYKAAEQWKDFTNFLPIPGTEVPDNEPDLYFGEPKTAQTVDCSIKTYSFDTQNSANGILTAYFETKGGAKIYLVYNTGTNNVTYIEGNAYSVTANSAQSFLAGYYSDGKPVNSYMEDNGTYYYITAGTINAANYAVGTELTVDVTSYYGTKIQFTSFISFYDPNPPTNNTVSGKCGENMECTLDTVSGKLDITGTGAIYDYPWWSQGPLWGCPPPWWYAEEGCYVAYPYYVATLDLPAGLTAIGDYAFAGCTQLTSITCSATTPPTLGTDVFKNVDTSIPVYVPAASVNDYKAADGWKDFTNIQLDDGTDPPTPPTPGTNTPNAVDLGLPSGLLWANYNVGATAETGYGNFYQWGCTTPVTREGWDIYCYGTLDAMTKYCTNSTYGTVDGKTELEAIDDAATQTWGNGWRMPTKDETQELWSNCSREKQTIDDVTGYRFTGPNGNSIFFPCAGWIDEEGVVHDKNYAGNYWTSTLYEANNNGAYGLLAPSQGVVVGKTNRYFGRLIRGVKTVATNEYIVNVTANSAYLGSVSGGGTYPSGTKVTLQAKASKGAQFVKWNDGVLSNTRVITVTSDTNFMAIFKAVASSSDDQYNRPANYDEQAGVITPWGQANKAELKTDVEPMKKILLDGQLYIVLPDGRWYNGQGKRVK